MKSSIVAVVASWLFSSSSSSSETLKPSNKKHKDKADGEVPSEESYKIDLEDGEVATKAKETKKKHLILPKASLLL